MARHHNAEGKQRNVSRRLATLEREVKAMTKEAPPRPEDVVARQAMKNEKPDFYRMVGNGDYSGVKRDIEQLGGRSTSGVVSDRERKSGSPLGRRR